MCDYSLMMVQSRLAVDGEELVAHRFRSGTVGLVSCFDFSCWQSKRPVGWKARVKSWFSADEEPAPVVCIPPGARLLLYGVPKSLQQEFHIEESVEATFTEISAQEGQHRDALRIGNESILMLMLLPEGQRLKVLRLSSEEDMVTTPGVNELALHRL